MYKHKVQMPTLSPKIILIQDTTKGQPQIQINKLKLNKQYLKFYLLILIKK